MDDWRDLEDIYDWRTAPFSKEERLEIYDWRDAPFSEEGILERRDEPEGPPLMQKAGAMGPDVDFAAEVVKRVELADQAIKRANDADSPAAKVVPMPKKRVR